MVKKKTQSNKSGTKLVFIGAFVPEDVKAAVEAYAANEGRSVSSTVRRILETANGVKAVLRQERAA